MANKNTNPGSGKDDNEMRIQFGMILTVLRGRRINENMVWTDSQDYVADEILYTIGTVLFNINNQLMREITILFEVYPQLFHSPRYLANGSNSVLREFAVACHYCKIMGKRSRNDDSVGGIFVDIRQLGGANHDVVCRRNCSKSILFLEV